MPNQTSVTITNGVPTAGTGTVSTLDALMADGGQATLGTTTGAAVTTDATGTLQQYLRGLVKALGALTSTGNALDINVKSGANNNGQAVMAASAPVVIASDQSKVPVHGNTAHGATDADNPLKQGFKATTALSGVTLVSTAQRSDAYSGVDGVQIVRPHCNLEDIVTGRATDTAGSSTTCIAAQAAGIKTYLTSINLTNSSATAITVNILDGVTVKATLSVPAGSGNNKEFSVPIPGTAATAWNFQGSAAATTLTCSMAGFKSKV